MKGNFIFWNKLYNKRPEDGQLCLVATRADDGSDTIEYSIYRYSNNLHKIDPHEFKIREAGFYYYLSEYDEYFKIENVVAWMLLPRLPETEESK